MIVVKVTRRIANVQQMELESALFALLKMWTIPADRALVIVTVMLHSGLKPLPIQSL